MIRFACPGCDARFTVDDEQAGKGGECPSCGARFRIPEAAPEVTKPPAEPSEALTAVCPHCRQAARVEAADVGHPVACPGCGETYTPGRGELAELPRRRRRDWGDERSRPRRRGERGPPPQVRTAGYLLLVGGIYSLVHIGALAVVTSGLACCFCALWPPWYVSLVWGILAIVRGSAYLGDAAGEAGRARTLQIVQVLAILNLDVVNCVLGVIGLSTTAAPEAEDYFDRYTRYADDE